MEIKQKYPEVDYGPLVWLRGEWTGEKGVDVAPEPDGTEENPYFETIVFEEAGALDNAERQKIAMVRYLQIVRRKSNGEVFHDQTGYWMWDADSRTVMHSLAIPRGLCLVAGDQLAANQGWDDSFEIKAESRDGGADWGIVQSPFLRDNARTVSFHLTLKVDEQALTYSETTNLQIYGRDLEHTDENVLTRVKR